MTQAAKASDPLGWGFSVERWRLRVWRRWPQELHDRDGSNHACSYELDHRFRITNVRVLDIEAGSLEQTEELFDRPAHSIETDDPAGIVQAQYSMGGEKPPMNRFAALWGRYLVNIDQGQPGDVGQVTCAMLWLAQLDWREADGKLCWTFLPPRRGRYLDLDPSGFRQAVNKREELSLFNPDRSILAGPDNQMCVDGRRAKCS